VHLSAAATAIHARICQWRKHAWPDVQRWKQHWPAASRMPRCKCDALWTCPDECSILLPISVLSFGASWMNHNLAGRKLENLFQPVCSITKPMAIDWVSAFRLTCKAQCGESMQCSFCGLQLQMVYAILITLCTARLFLQPRILATDFAVRLEQSCLLISGQPKRMFC